MYVTAVWAGPLNTRYGAADKIASPTVTPTEFHQNTHWNRNHVTT